MELLILALIAVESGGKDNAIGDKHLAQKAYGCLQIRQPVCNDYNKAHGTKHQAKDCLGNRELSVKICRWYLEHWCNPERLGRNPLLNDYLMIWRGGPNGWKQKPVPIHKERLAKARAFIAKEEAKKKKK